MNAALIGINERKELLLHIDKVGEPLSMVSDLSNADINKEYLIKDIQSVDEELKNFLFSLGCFKGESITIISVLAEIFVISVKDARYSIDADLARAILV